MKTSRASWSRLASVLSAASVVGVSLAACGGKGANDAGTVACSNGETRPRIDCASEVKYDGVTTSGGASVLNLGAANVQSEDVAIRRINENVEKYIAGQARLCREYNACVVDAKAYGDEA